MMVITSKLYLQVIHEATKKIENKSDMDIIHLKMQEATLQNLADVKEDDVMIDGYYHSAFTPYQEFVQPIQEVIQEKIKQCDTCSYTYPVETMIQKQESFYCEECL